MTIKDIQKLRKDDTFTTPGPMRALCPDEAVWVVTRVAADGSLEVNGHWNGVSLGLFRIAPSGTMVRVEKPV